MLSAGGAGAGAARHRAHPGLFAGGARTQRADVPHPAGPVAEGAEAGRHRRCRGRQPVPEGDLYCPAQRPLCGCARRGRLGLCAAAENQWRDVLAIQEERTVAPDNTVAWKGRRLQIPAHAGRAHYVRAKVRVHEYPDGELAIFHGPRCLVRWRSEDAEPATEMLPRQRLPLAPPPGSCGNRGKAEKAFPPFPQEQQQKAVNSCAT